MLDAWKTAAKQLKREVHAIALAARDPRVPWYAKALAVCVVAYAVSPIDLVPDMIPVLGYLDDLVLLPIGIMLVRRLIPAEVLSECRARAEQASIGASGWIAAGVILFVWIACALALTVWLFHILRA